MDIMSETARLSLQEGVLLTHALLAFISYDNNIRSVFIKGPAAVEIGLRPEHQSTDADIFVDPVDLEKFCNLIRSLGWQNRPSDPVGHRLPTHSLTFFNPLWPNDIDVHYSFPGLEASNLQVFETLWRERISLSVAGQTLLVPGLEASRIILVTHSLRAIWKPREKAEYDYILSLEIDDVQLFLKLCQELGALAATRPFIEEKIGPAAISSWPKPSREWEFRTTHRPGALRRLQILIDTPWKNKPITLFRDFFPSKDAFLMNDLYADVSFSGMIQVYAKRLVSAARFIYKLCAGK